MKTIITAVLMCITSLCWSQDDGEAKLNECKTLTLQLLKNNTSNKDLTDCMVSLAIKGGDYINQYNAWMTQVIKNSQEEIQAELSYLENQKSKVTEARQQSFNSLLDNVNQNVQNKVNLQNKSAAPKSSLTYRCDDCPIGTAR
ncbi:hypothetical protein [Flavobacterium pectinovorum]|uniref:hypothetical protein n=1 Tax=Flavobacterium pectinovorum TaxID=29533 RepID=UPI001FADB423|nr:hypothetical protein [Flavobacterium pectinovorum]MCI9844757.1 hypothetical protein [Flavobacterium pectinovorum]